MNLINALLVNLIIFSFSIHANADLISDTCRKTEVRTLCERILRSDPKGAGADVAGLALIMLKAAKNKTSDLLCLVNRLIYKGTDPAVVAAYKQCKDLYDFIYANNVVQAISALERMEAGDPKFAEQAMNDAVDKFNTCESRLSGKPTSPLDGQNKIGGYITKISVSIIKTLEGI